MVLSFFNYVSLYICIFKIFYLIKSYFFSILVLIQFFFFRFENVLREKILDVMFLYWDLIIDEVMVNFVVLVIWSDCFIGNGNGFVINGFFVDWMILVGFLIRNIVNMG